MKIFLPASLLLVLGCSGAPYSPTLLVIAEVPFMQNTRLNNLFNTIALRLRLWFFNPWRRFSVLIISCLFGFFLGSAVATTSGQTAEWDIVVAGVLLTLTEVGSRIYYGRSIRERQALWVESLNILKIGFMYSLFLEAFKLGS